MNLLAFDTATGACSVALWRDGIVSAHETCPMQRGHAERLMPMIRDVLARADLGYAALQALAVTVGPGSFTGLRVGLGAARGLSLALGLPLVGITTLEAIALGASRKLEDTRDPARLVLSAIETRRADIYVQLFTRDSDPRSEPAALMPEDVPAILPDEPVRVAGDAAARLAGALARSGSDITVLADITSPDAALVALAAARTIGRRGMPDRSVRPAPLYIHPPRATLPVNGGRLRP